MRRSPLEFGDLWVGVPEPAPPWRDVAAAVLVFIVLPCALALAAVGAYLAAVPR